MVVNWETIKIRTCFLDPHWSLTLLGNWPQGLKPLLRFILSNVGTGGESLVIFINIFDLLPRFWLRHLATCPWKITLCLEFLAYLLIAIESVTWYIGGNSKQAITPHTCTRFLFRLWRENQTWEWQRRFCILECANVCEMLSSILYLAEQVHMNNHKKYWLLKYTDTFTQWRPQLSQVL